MTEDTNPSTVGAVLIEICLTIWFLITSFLQAAYRNFIPSAWQNKKSLTGKVVLITGAGGGIGSQLASQLSHLGAKLVLWDNNVKLLESVVQSCKELGATVSGSKIDITDRSAVYSAAQEVSRKFGKVDILINNAALLNPHSFIDSNDDKIDLLIDVNVKSLFWVTKAFLTKMLEDKEGHIVCISSVSSLCGCPGLVDYSASKYAATGFMEALQHELLQTGHDAIKFTTICPMFVRTKLIEKFKIFDARMPVFDAEEVAAEIIEAIQIEQQFRVIPNSFNAVTALKGFVPRNVFQYVVFHKRFQYG